MKKQFVSGNVITETCEPFFSQRKVKGNGCPVALALRVMFPPATTLWLSGDNVITGRTSTTNVALLLTTAPKLFDTLTV